MTSGATLREPRDSICRLTIGSGEISQSYYASVGNLAFPSGVFVSTRDTLEKRKHFLTGTFQSDHVLFNGTFDTSREPPASRYQTASFLHVAQLHLHALWPTLAPALNLMVWSPVRDQRYQITYIWRTHVFMDSVCHVHD